MLAGRLHSSAQRIPSLAPYGRFPKLFLLSGVPPNEHHRHTPADPYHPPRLRAVSCQSLSTQEVQTAVQKWSVSTQEQLDKGVFNNFFTSF